MVLLDVHTLIVCLCVCLCVSVCGGVGLEWICYINFFFQSRHVSQALMWPWLQMACA